MQKVNLFDDPEETNVENIHEDWKLCPLCDIRPLQYDSEIEDGECGSCRQKSLENYYDEDLLG